MKVAPAITDAITDPALFAPHFRDSASWGPWWAFCKALFGLPLAETELALYRECTARQDVPTERASEAWLCVGRRGGKSRVLALIAAYLACFVDWEPFLAPGERGTIAVIAADRRQCRTIMGYVRAFLLETAILRDRVTDDRKADEIELGPITIEVATCSFRTIRGRTIIAALCDEAAFWADEAGANPASEVIASLRPAMATIPGSMLLVASSPYAQRGPLHDAVKRYFGKPGSILVWKAPTWVMNPSLPRDGAVISEAYDRDPASAAAEYGAEFRRDIEAFIAREVVDALVVPGRFELLPVSGVSYVAYTDPSGGSADSMTLAIAHQDKDGRSILDAVRERRPPFSPDDVVQEFAALLKSYQVRQVHGDRYGGEWPRERFKVAGIDYELSDRPASDFYRDVLPLLNSGRAELLDHPRLASQLANLERRTSRSGKDAISHPPQGHDDIANAVAGALVLTASGSKPLVITSEMIAQVRGHQAPRWRVPQGWSHP